MDRMVMSYAVVQIGKEFNLNASLIGLVLSSFFIGYAIMQIPGGWLADRFGSRKVLLVIVFVWSIFTGLTGSAWSLLSLLIYSSRIRICGRELLSVCCQDDLTNLPQKGNRSRSLHILEC